MPIIAVDGPAGSGKSSTARAVAERIGFVHMDSGALYRAVTLAALREGVVDRAAAVVQLGRMRPVTLEVCDGRLIPTIGGRSVEAEIRSEAVTAAVSAVAAMPEVREWVTEQLRRIADSVPTGVVMDGRDIGTVVFPHADLKIFMTASVEERARRRGRELGVADPAGLGRLVAELELRDRADSERGAAPLVRPIDALDIDTTKLSFDQQVDSIVSLARKAFPDLETDTD